MSIYMDVINIFIRILAILSGSSGKRKWMANISLVCVVYSLVS